MWYVLIYMMFVPLFSLPHWTLARLTSIPFATEAKCQGFIGELKAITAAKFMDDPDAPRYITINGQPARVIGVEYLCRRDTSGQAM